MQFLNGLWSINARNVPFDAIMQVCSSFLPSVITSSEDRYKINVKRIINIYLSAVLSAPQSQVSRENVRFGIEKHIQTFIPFITVFV
jgi:hypothetical protein